MHEYSEGPVREFAQHLHLPRSIGLSRPVHTVKYYLSRPAPSTGRFQILLICANLLLSIGYDTLPPAPSSVALFLLQEFRSCVWSEVLR
ncbi:unnamed protein product [Calypogeia fissa]